MILEYSAYRVHDLSLLLIAHGHDGQHEVDEVEGAEEDDNGEEDHVYRTPGCHHLNDPIILIWRLT